MLLPGCAAGELNKPDLMVCPFAHGCAQSLPPREVAQRLANLLPPLLTLYDTGDAVELSTITPRAVCYSTCLAAGNSTQACNAACVWRCVLPQSAHRPGYPGT